MITITIKTDDAAFKEAPIYELTRVFRILKDYIESGYFDPNEPMIMPIRDTNGNSVGRMEYSP